MRKLSVLALAAVMVLGALASAHAATEVKMTGDARVYGNFFSGRNFTGYSPNGARKNENFEIWQRFRLRTDFVANEAVKFRLGLQVNDTWGRNTYTAANPSAQNSLQVYQAYLQFKWPGSDVQITAGLQDMSLPHSSMFKFSPVWGDDRFAALVIQAPLIPDTLSVLTGFGRLIDTNQTFDNAAGAGNNFSNSQSDELDAYFLALPITLDGFKATPWGMIANAGRNAVVNGYARRDTTDNWAAVGGETFASTLLSSRAMGSVQTANGGQISNWRNTNNAYYWIGGAFEVTALDPIRFYADVIYGAGAMADRKSNHRSGWFIDLGAEYTGLDMVTPQVFAWWSTGEDKSTNNGSERMPYMRGKWGPGNSFLFDCGQTLANGASMNVSPVGNYGIGASLDKMSFIEKLTHRLTFTYVHGNNSATGIRRAIVANDNNYFVMGRDLTKSESLVAINFDTKYMIYENLAAVMETGWAHGTFQRNIWRVSNSYHSPVDAWKVAFGLTYKF